MTSLSSLFGQEAAIGALRRGLESDCLAGTYIFIGAPGVGKGTLARAFAQAAACLSPVREPFDSCGRCDSCRRAIAGAQPEIVTVGPAGEHIQIWQFWERASRPGGGILSRTLHYAPAIGRRRVYIVEQAETLNESAANSMLKVLEEPPPYVVFVLLAPHAARVLPTIVSRSQMVRLSSVPVEELTAYLSRSAGLDGPRAAMFAAYSEGRIGQAVTLATTPAVSGEIARVIDFAETLPEAPPARALRAAEQIRKLGAQMKALVGAEPASGDLDDDANPKEKTARRQIAAVFDLLTAFYRDLLALRVGAAESVVNRDRIERMRRLAARGEPERWQECLDALLLARRRLMANANVNLVTEVLTMALLSRR